jgi:ABC-type polysaccharide/polyol phosphate export permease
MPAPLQAFSRVNPLTYVIQALRDALVYSNPVACLQSIAEIALFSLTLVALATLLLGRIVE